MDLSSLAQKANDAAARIESEIKDSIGYVDAGTDRETTLASDDNNEKNYFEEEEEVSFSEADVDPSERRIENAVKDENRHDDGNGGWDHCEDLNTKGDPISMYQAL